MVCTNFPVGHSTATTGTVPTHICSHICNADCHALYLVAVVCMEQSILLCVSAVVSSGAAESCRWFCCQTPLRLVEILGWGPPCAWRGLPKAVLSPQGRRCLCVFGHVCRHCNTGWHKLSTVLLVPSCVSAQRRHCPYVLGHVCSEHLPTCCTRLCLHMMHACQQHVH